MRREIAAVVFFLKRLVKKGEKLESHKVELFVERLAVALQEKFKGHWYPENPSKGQAYRCCPPSFGFFFPQHHFQHVIETLKILFAF